MTAIPPLVEALPQECHEKIARTLTGGLNRDISEKNAVDEPSPTLPFSHEHEHEHEHGASAQPSAFRRTRKYWIVVAAFFYFFFVLGLNGGSTGPLLPRYQQFYQIDYLTVSMIFVSNACGSLTAATITHFFGKRVKFSTLVISASLLPLAGYSIMSSAPPFGVMCMCFFINAINFSLINTQANAVLALLPSKTLLGLGHSLFGAGALVAPLISTQFAQIPRWSFHYLVLLGVAIGDFVQMVGVFRGRGFDDILNEMGIAPERPNDPTSPTSTDLSGMAKEKEVADVESSEQASGILPKKLYAPLLALFMFLCVGVEVSIGGWIVTFMMNERGGGPSSGYVSTGYYAGLSFGRAALIWVNNSLGERNAVFLYITIIIALELTIWFVHSLIGNAIAVSLVGCLLGPLFPIVMSQAQRILPRESLTASIGWIAGTGQAGSALLPFATGALANRYGIIALQPLIVAMMGLLGACWFLIPPVQKTREPKDSAAADTV